MKTISLKKTLWVVLLSFLFIGCVKEVEQQQPQGELHEVVFHAGWAPETKTVLQDDGSVWWSPGDEISLFVGDGNNGGYKLASTNDEPSATADFIGNIRKKSSTETYTAIYPYNEANKVDGNTIHTVIPAIQTAKEGTFEQKAFVSIARSDNENLYFRNLCSGIKFSVKNTGIKKIVISTRDDASIAGGVSYSIDSGNWRFDSDASPKVTVKAPSVSGFEVGKFYYAVLFPFKNDLGVDITYCMEDKIAVFEYQMPIEFKRGVFKRLYEKDADLQFHGSKAIFKTNEILPEGVDKEHITQALFLTCNDTKTETIIPCSVEEGYEPIYFELDGTVAKYYTNASTIEIRTAWEMFYGWKSIKKLDLSMFNTEQSMGYSQMFAYCNALENLNISAFNTENGSSFGNMFLDCFSLKSLDVSSFNTSNARSLYGMFSGCKQLRTLDVSGFKTSSVTAFGYMFYDCHNLAHIDVSKFDLSSAEDVSDMFYRCYLLSDIDTQNWKSSKIINMNRMFTDCRSVSSLDLSGLELSRVNNMSSMFSGCSNLSDLKLSKIGTPHLITWGLSWMFADCQKLKALDLSNFDTSDVENFGLVFYQCYNLKSLNLNGWNTSNATDMKWMFLGCSSLQNVDLSMFDTSKVTNMNKLFNGCSSLEKLDLSNWNTSNVTDMSGAFEGCRNLEVLDISGFSSDHLSDVYAMFGYTHKLSAINMGDLDISSLSMENTFYEMAKNTPHCYIRCTESQKVAIEPNLNNSEKIVWITDASSLPDDISSIDESLYYSTDYSKDKTVKVLQKSSEGAGVDLVLMGDGYSDRMIESGEYDRDMERAVESIFQYEPFKSFRHLFNIYIAYAVSENEVIGKSTVFDSYATRATVGHIGSNDSQRIFSYSMNVSGKGDPRDVATIVVLNSEVSDGVCINFLQTSHVAGSDYRSDPNWDDYHGGHGYAVVSGPKQDGYEETVIHEFGHMFGKLADEYVNDGDDYQSISEQEKLNLQEFFPYGMNKNIDVTDAPSSIKWSHFLSDSRYSNSGTGIFEGANQYRTGVWRPSENSIMRNMSGQFNAPSREAIYYRIHKLAYGKDWQYNFEDFVQWDFKNIQSESKASAQSIPYPARVNDRKPFFKMEKIRDNDGREMIRMIMN